MQTQWWPPREKWPEYPPDADGDRLCTAEAIALLILDECVIALNANGPDKVAGLYVHISDTFYYASADGEPIPVFDAVDNAPLWRLYDLYREHGADGATLWVMERRKRQPLEQYRERLKAAGLWRPEFDSFPKAD